MLPLLLLACVDVEPLPTEEPALVGCEDDGTTVRCGYATHTLLVDGLARDVHYALPAGEAPVDGWPIAVLYQGSFVSGETYFTGGAPAGLGAYQQTHLVRLLLEAGYAVLAPEARDEGALYWDTNIFPFSESWEHAFDHAMLLALDDALDVGVFGALDPGDRVAAGISSGGYMTSRMAVSYPGAYRALAIQSASYATCLAERCEVPEVLPADHPPTLFLHGGLDIIVPPETNTAYRERLAAQGTPVDLRFEEDIGHAWFAGGPEAIVEWFEDHR